MNELLINENTKNINKIKLLEKYIKDLVDESLIYQKELNKLKIKSKVEFEHDVSNTLNDKFKEDISNTLNDILLQLNNINKNEISINVKDTVLRTKTKLTYHKIVSHLNGKIAINKYSK